MIALHWSKHCCLDKVQIISLHTYVVSKALKDLFERSCSKRFCLKCCINDVQTGTLTQQLTWKVLLKLAWRSSSLI